MKIDVEDDSGAGEILIRGGAPETCLRGSECFEDPAAASRDLGDGYRVEVRIVVWEAKDVVTAPTSSLFRRGEGWAVFVVEGGRARLRPITVGERNGLQAQVREGLRPGEQVIVHPADAIEDGDRVAPRA